MNPVAATPGERQPERRQHTRYPVEGSVVLQTKEARYTGTPVNLSLGGILFIADPPPPAAAAGIAQLQVVGFDETIHANAQVIRTHETGAVAVFLGVTAQLSRCVEWLAKRGSRLPRAARNAGWIY